MAKVVVAVAVLALGVFGLSSPSGATERTETVTWSYFGEQEVSCDIHVYSSRTVEGDGAHRRTHLSVITGLEGTSDQLCFDQRQDIAATLVYRRKGDDEPETIETHNYGAFTAIIDITVNGTLASAKATHLAQFDCSDVHPCVFTFDSSPK